MAKITDISYQKRDKNRCNVSVDGEYDFAVSLEQVIKYKIKVGTEFTDLELNEIKLEGEKEFALKKALNYISKALKTKKQVIIYLKGKGYSDKAVYYVIDKLKEYNFINDEEYAKAYLENNKTEGKKLVDYKLMMKGVNKNDILNAREGFLDSSKEIAENLADKRLKNKAITSELLQKTYRYLIGKGFSYEEAEYAIKKYKNEL